MVLDLVPSLMPILLQRMELFMHESILSQTPRYAESVVSSHLIIMLELKI
jgi:hypothetical protein